MNELSKKLIDVVNANKHHKFQLVCNMAQFVVAIELKNEFKKLSKSFRQEASANYENYIYQLKKGIDDIKLIITASTLDKCSKFFREEQNLYKQILQEYLVYLFSGNLLSAIRGEERRPLEMFDYRNGNWIGEFRDE